MLRYNIGPRRHLLDVIFSELFTSDVCDDEVKIKFCDFSLIPIHRLEKDFFERALFTFYKRLLCNSIISHIDFS